jgi:hypothetical protein
MRAVQYKPNQLNYPDNWMERAQKALDAAANSTEEERAAIVNRYRLLWAELKPELAKVMHGKCWYTESLQVGTDTDVDHFRPKNSVKNVKRKGTQESHPGYWWKAFDPQNYRYSCIVANRLRRDVETGIVGGKADEFPLWDEKERAWIPSDNCEDEQPLLIDPCNAAEVAWITFADNGEATEKYHRDDKPKCFEKANQSILLYHLNHPDFVRERIKIRDNLRKSIEDAKRYYQKLDEGDATVSFAYQRAIEALRQACSEKAPFSSFAIAMLRPYSFHDFLEGVFIGLGI